LRGTLRIVRGGGAGARDSGSSARRCWCLGHGSIAVLAANMGSYFGLLALVAGIILAVAIAAMLIIDVLL
jgi:hypothetical protein